MKKIIITIIVFIALCNIPPLKWVFTWFDHDDYRYSNYNGSFTFQEIQSKGADFDLCMYRFNNLKKTGEISDTVLYRLNRNNPFKFWRYGDYLLKGKYHLSYQAWDAIKKRRGPIDHFNAQDF